MTRQIQFCNEHARVFASTAAYGYYFSIELNTRWNATAEGDRLQVLGSILIQQANQLTRGYYAAKRLYSQWQAEGETAFIASDATVIEDGSPQDGRPQADGEAINLVAANRSIDYSTWLDQSGGWYLNSVLKPAMSTVDNLTAADAAEVVNRGNELVVEYEADNNAKLNTILALAEIQGA